MLRTICPPSPMVNKLAHSALAIISQDFMSASNCPTPEASHCAIEMLRTCAGLNEQGSIANIEPAAQRAAPSLDIAVDDWDLMFRAVEERLRTAVGGRLVATSGLQGQDAACPIQGIVLECVSALEQLHTALTQERGQRVLLEVEIGDAQAALARALTNFLLLRPQQSVLAT